MQWSRAQKLLVIGEGLGAAGLVHALAQRGDQVLYAGPPERSQRALLGAALDEANLRERVTTLNLERLQEASLDLLFEQAAEAFEQLDAVISLHEVAPEAGPVPPHELSLSAFRSHMEQGLRAPFLVARRALQEFLTSGGGRLLHLVTTSRDASGSAVQGALGAFTRSVALEYARRSVICNGVLLQRAASPDAGGNPRLRELLGAGHSPLNQAALFLSSQGASFVNGECLMLDEEDAHER